MANGAAESVFLDTGVLLAASISSAPGHERAAAAVQARHALGCTLWTSRQVLRELLAALTRPDVNPPLTPDQVSGIVRHWSGLLKVADDGEDVTEALLDLLGAVPMAGARVHDANIVATMRAKGLSTLMTLDPDGFVAFDGLIRVECLSEDNHPMTTQAPDPIDEVIEPLKESLETDDPDVVARARESLEQTIAGLKLSPEEEAALADELKQLRDLSEKLDTNTVEIAAFGLVSRGKSSVLNALCGQDVFTTGATHGTTVIRSAHPWQTATLSGTSGFEDARLVLVDTPGIDEVGGEVREAMARELARHSDLLLFVVSGDMVRVEFEALAQLREANKPILLVFNQIDRYPDADRDIIYQKIKDERVKDLIKTEDVVMTAARPDPYRVKVRRPDGSTSLEWEYPEPIIEPLKTRILEVLEREGKALVALNTLLYAGDLHQEIVDRKMRLRDERANDAIWKFAIAKGAAVALNPIMGADLAGGLAVDVTMIVALSRIYGIPLTKQTAISLVKDMLKALGALGAVKVVGHVLAGGVKSLLAGATVLSGGLAAPLTFLGIGAIGLAQGAAGGAISYVLGHGAKIYLQQGCQWGPRGIRTVIAEILQQAKRDSVLDRLKEDLRGKVKGTARK